MGQKFDVVIAGAGITGLAAAHHLEQRGCTQIAMAAPRPSEAVSWQAAGMLSGGWFDNHTRLSHAYGAATAHDAWHFGDAAFDALAHFAQSQGLTIAMGRRLRMATSIMEAREMQTAVRDLAAGGFPSRWLDLPALKSSWPALTDRTQAIQEDGSRCGFIDPKAIEQALQTSVAAPRIEAVRSFESVPGGLKLSLRDGRTIFTELLIVATHLSIPDLLPELTEALVPIADQWHELQIEELPTPWDQAGLVFSINHGYEWGVTRGQGRIALGGARYVRKLAGIGAQESVVEEPVRRALLANFAQTFTFGNRAKVVASFAGRDCRPCDELPVIGPMFGEGRVLLASGYMGLGLTQGFFAGACLAELILTGHCAALPRRFWPERLRSLSA